MPTKKKEVIFTPLTEKQLLAAKYNSLHKRGHRVASTKKYFTQVMRDIRHLATGKNTGAWSPHSTFFTQPKPDDILRCSLKQPPASTLWDLFILNKMQRPNWLMKTNYYNGWANKTIPPDWKDCETKGCNTSLRKYGYIFGPEKSAKMVFSEQKALKM